MAWNHEERKQKLMEYANRDAELNGKAGAEIFDTEFIDYDEDNVVTVRFHIKPWQRNPFGNLQGGMQCYYIDFIGGIVSWVMVEGEPIGTVDVNVNFIRAIPETAEYVDVRGKVISLGRRVIVANVEIRDPEGWLMATGITNTTRMLGADPSPTIVDAPLKTVK